MIASPGNVHYRGPIRGYRETEYLAKRLWGYGILNKAVL